MRLRTSIIAGALLILGATSTALRWRELREPVLQNHGHQLLLAHSTIIAQNWFHEGFWKLRGLAFWDIELQRPYTSFPGGAFIIPYLAGRITGAQPTVLAMKAYGALNQFLCAVLLFFLAREILRRLKAGTAATALDLWALLPAATLLFTPAWQWHFPHSWFGESAALAPFLTLVLFDLKGKRRAACVAAAAMAYCDLAFALEVSLWRLLLWGSWRELPYYFGPFATVLAVHFAAIVSLLGLSHLKDLFFHAQDHASEAIGLIDLVKRYKGYLSIAYGQLWWLYPPLLATFALWAARAKKTLRPAMRAMALLCVPPVTHLLLFRKHAFHHNFNTLRIDPGFALLLFAFIPRRFIKAMPLALLAAAVYWHHVYRVSYVKGTPTKGNEAFLQLPYSSKL